MARFRGWLPAVCRRAAVYAHAAVVQERMRKFALSIRARFSRQALPADPAIRADPGLPAGAAAAYAATE